MNKYEKEYNFMMIEKTNSEFSVIFHDFLKYEICWLCDNFDNGFYKKVKTNMYNNLMLTNNIIKKMDVEKYSDEKRGKMDGLVSNLIMKYGVYTNILRLYYKHNRELINYEDHILFNIKKTYDIKIILELKDNNDKYYYRKLPSYIIERDYNIYENYKVSIFVKNNKISKQNNKLYNKHIHRLYISISEYKIDNIYNFNFYKKHKYNSCIIYLLIPKKKYYHPKCVKKKYT